MDQPSAYSPPQRLWHFKPTKSPRRIDVSFPYEERWVKLVKTIPDRKYDADTKCWSIPVRQLKITLKTLDYYKIPYKIDDAKIKKAHQELLVRENELIEIKFGNFDPLPPIKGLRTSPYPYQEEGIRFLTTAGSAILAYSMGLGKTVSALSSCLYLGGSSVLIICPSTLKWHWQREIAKHTDKTSVLIHGTSHQRKVLWNTPATFYICSYELINFDWELLQEKMWDIVICDEATRIKNSRAKTTKLVKSIKCVNRFALTGTPVENKLEDIHSILDWCQPGILGSLYFFLDRYAVKNFFGSIIGYKKEGIKEVRQIIAPYILRREKTSEFRGKPILADLPPKLPTKNVVVEFSQAERCAYKELTEEILELIRADAINPMTRALRCKQFTTSPLLLGTQLDGPKLREMAEILNEGHGHKFLLFSEFAEAVKLYAARLGLVYLTGETPQVERQRLIDQFNSDPEQRALICSNVAGYGVEITGADVVVHIDTPWNPATKEQREDRAWRPGQTRAVNVLRLFVLSTIDDRIEQVIQSKMNLQHELLDEENFDYKNAINSLTKQDWEKILTAA